MTDAKVPDALTFLQWLKEEVDYTDLRLLPDGRYAGIAKFMFTSAVIVGTIGDIYGFDDRWCYHSTAEAVAALNAWDGTGEPKGWHRHPASGRRVSETGGEIDGDGNQVARGAQYVRP